MRQRGATWSSWRFAALEDTACLLADPITREAAFSELLAWHMADRIPARYQPYGSPGCLAP
jgi:hypothetical protein